jgi:hypothetical protein
MNVGGTDVSQISEGFDDAAGMPGSARGRHSSATSAVHRSQKLTGRPGRVFHAAFLLMHGEDDRVVSPRQSLLMHRARLPAAGVWSRRVVFGQAGHGMLGSRRNDVKVCGLRCASRTPWSTSCTTTCNRHEAAPGAAASDGLSSRPFALFT